MRNSIPKLPTDLQAPDRKIGLFGRIGNFVKTEFKDFVGDVRNIAPSISRELTKSTQKQSEIAQSTARGEQSPIVGTGQFLGRSALTASNILGELTTGVVKAAIPKFGEKAIQSGLEFTGEKVVAPLLQTSVAQQLLQNYNDLSSSSKRNIIAFGGVGSLALDLFPGGKAGKEIIEKAINDVSDIVKISLATTKEGGEISNILKKQNPIFDLLSPQTIETIAKNEDPDVITSIIKRDLELQYKQISKANDIEVRLAEERLPTKLTAKEIDANTVVKASQVLDDVIKDAAKISAIELENKLRGSVKSKLAFVTKTNELSPVLIQDVKKTLGIESPISKMSRAELERTYSEVQKRVNDIDKPTVVDNTVSPEEYLEASIIDTRVSVIETALRSSKKAAESAAKSLDKHLH